MALFGKFSGTNDTVGIDIGSHSIKVVQVSLTRHGYTLTRAGSTPTPAEAIKQGLIDDRLAVADEIRSLLQRLGIPTSLAVAAVAGPTVVVRQVQLPAMPEHQLRKSIHWEARNYISFPVEDSLLEFQILGTRNTDGTPQMDVMLVAAPRDLVDSRVETLEQAGLDPIAMELEPFALMRAVVDLGLGIDATNETVALVDIGAMYSHISIISRGNFVLSRSVTVAGNSFTEAIANILSVDNAQAEEVKENDLEMVMDEVTRATLSPVGQEASRALEPLMEELVREIRRSFAFYDYQQTPAGGEGRASGSGVSKIILTGGSARMRGLPAFLQDQLGIVVSTVDLFGNGVIQLPANAEELYQQGPRLATAFGLALREPMLAHERGGIR